MRQSHGSMVAIGGVVAMGLLSPVQADNKTIRRELEALYTQRAQANAEKDTAKTLQFYEKYAAPDFILRGMKGKSATRSRYLSLIKNDKKPPRLSGSQPDKVSLHRLVVRANQAIVVVTIMGILEHNPQRHIDRVGTSRERDTWVRTAEGWKIKRLEPLSYTETLNGKVIARLIRK